MFNFFDPETQDNGSGRITGDRNYWRTIESNVTREALEKAGRKQCAGCLKIKGHDEFYKAGWINNPPFCRRCDGHLPKMEFCAVKLCTDCQQPFEAKSPSEKRCSTCKKYDKPKSFLHAEKKRKTETYKVRGKLGSKARAKKAQDASKTNI